MRRHDPRSPHPRIPARFPFSTSSLPAFHYHTIAMRVLALLAPFRTWKPTSVLAVTTRSTWLQNRTTNTVCTSRCLPYGNIKDIAPDGARDGHISQTFACHEN